MTVIWYVRCTTGTSCRAEMYIDTRYLKYTCREPVEQAEWIELKCTLVTLLEIYMQEPAEQTVCTELKCTLVTLLEIYMQGTSRTDRVHRAKMYTDDVTWNIHGVRLRPPFYAFASALLMRLRYFNKSNQYWISYVALFMRLRYQSTANVTRW